MQHLIPGLAGFISLKRQEKCDSILVNIERFVSANDLIANTIEQQNDIILAHEKQIPELQKHFLSCMNALHEHSLCLIEKIDDIYHSKTHHIGSEKATKNLYDDPQKLWSIFEEIYHHSKSYEEYALSLADSFQKAQIISSDKKEAINLEDILRTTFANRYTDLTVTNFPNAKSTQPHKVFFAKAVEEAIKSLLEIGHKDDYQINLHIGHESISIEIALHITNKPINNGDIQLSLQKARLFSLLDEGFVGILRTENSLIFTIVYTENQDLNRTQRVVL